MKKVLLCCIVLSWCLLGSGCAGSMSSGDLRSLDRKLKYTKTGNGLIYKEPGFSVSSVDCLVLHPVAILVDPSAQQIKSQELAKKLASDLDVALKAQIPQKTHLSVRQPGESAPITMEKADLHITVTKMDPGSGFARWFIGAGAGATVIQIEGELKVQQDDRLAIAFADKRAHSGNPTLGFNVSAMSDEYTCKELCKAFVAGVIKILSDTSQK